MDASEEGNKQTAMTSISGPLGCVTVRCFLLIVVI